MSIERSRIWAKHAEAAQARIDRYSHSPRHNAGRIKQAKRDLSFARQRSTQELLRGKRVGDVMYLDWKEMTEAEQRKVSERMSKRKDTVTRFIYENEKDGRSGTGYEEYRGADTLYAESKKDRKYKRVVNGQVKEEIDQRAKDLTYLAVVRFRKPKVKE